MKKIVISQVLITLSILICSCDLRSPPGGDCGTDIHVGDDYSCQCVVPKIDKEPYNAFPYTMYAQKSQSYEDAGKIDTMACIAGVYKQTMGLKENEAITCINHQCGKRQCPTGYYRSEYPGFDCVSKSGEKEIVLIAVNCKSRETYNSTLEACECDASRHYVGNVGNCKCDDGYIDKVDYCLPESQEQNIADTSDKIDKTSNTDDLSASSCNYKEIEDNSGNCVCNTQKHYIGTTGNCKCEDGYTEINIKVGCTKDSTPSGTPECTGKGKILSGKLCVCDGANNWVENSSGDCVCDEQKNAHETADEQCVICQNREEWNEESKSCVSTLQAVMPCTNLTNPKVGGFCTFGKYPQTAKGDDQTDIDWLILSVDERAMLLISKYVLEARHYHTEWTTSVTWEKSTIRAWLNGLKIRVEVVNSNNTVEDKGEVDYTSTGFIKTAFNNVERAKIKTVTNKNEFNPEGGSDPDTEDQIFYLSASEAESLFSTIGSKAASCTEYAKTTGLVPSPSDCTGEECIASWTTRTPGQYYAGYVVCTTSVGGGLYYTGYEVFSWKLGVRPALWLEFK